MRFDLSCAAACVAVLIGVAPALAGTSKDIGRWSTSCTSGLTCLLSYEDVEGGELGTISLMRTGALNADIELRLPKPKRFSRNLDPNGVFRLSVDGKAVLDLPVRQLQFDAERNGFVSSDQPAAQILLEAMKGGTRLKLDYEGFVGRFSSSMALDGIRGSLYFIDDVQGRRGRNDALFAVGRTVPEGTDSKDIDSFDDIPASIRTDFTDEKGSCTDGLEPDDIGRYGGFDISLDGTRLVLVPCRSAGAYNQPYALYSGFLDGPLTRISFPDVDEGRPSISEDAYNVDFDPQTRIMTAFVKDIGLGTCGLWHKWQVTPSGHLVLLERRGWYECDGSREGPEDFPLEWPVDKQP